MRHDPRIDRILRLGILSTRLARLHRGLKLRDETDRTELMKGESQAAREFFRLRSIAHGQSMRLKTLFELSRKGIVPSSLLNVGFRMPGDVSRRDKTRQDGECATTQSTSKSSVPYLTQSPVLPSTIRT